MQKRHKDLLRILVKELRHILAGHQDDAGAWQRGDLDRELERLGFAPDGAITPIDALRNPTPEEVRAYRVAEVQLAPLPQEQRPPARAELIERAAYSWINRLLALRAMEARDLIDETLRQNPAYDGVSEALYILRHQAPARTTGADAGWWAVIEDACDVLSDALPGLFDPADPAVALRPSTSALLRCIALVGGPINGFTLEQSDAAFADPDAIGWAYQFYQEEAKARVYSKLNRGGKAETRAEIAAVTQLFTEPYMVKWLLQNSLGRSYHEAYPDSRLPDTWEYYIDRSKIEGLEDEPPARTFTLPELTVMDPCMGSGHFLREAFDMLVAMYREQHPAMDAREIADRILRDHLYGIDLDPRAAQLAALTLYLRAWELVRDEQRRQGEYGPVAYQPLAMNLATTPSRLDEGALERHLQRHPEDRIFKPLLEGIFAALEQAHILGSLLRPGEHLDEALAGFQNPGTIPLGLDEDEAALRRTLTELAKHDPAELKRLLLDRVAQSFATEADNADVAAALFGREAEQGVRLLQLLDRQYAVVVTNPPYMGSGNMDVLLRNYIRKHYGLGHSDLYSAFVLRCLQLCCDSNRVAMITQHNWMFLTSFADFRALFEKKLVGAQNTDDFTGLVRETCIEVLAHLGANAFEEISGQVVQSAMFVLKNEKATPAHQIISFRLIGLDTPKEKARALHDSNSDCVNYSRQIAFLSVPKSPLVYWAPSQILNLLQSNERVKDIADVKRGLDSGEDKRFVRHWWEIHGNGWLPYSKGGGYSKWYGLNYYCIDWRESDVRYSDTKGARIQNQQYYFRPFLTYTLMAQGSLGVRFIEDDAVPGGAAGGIYPNDGTNSSALCAYLNSRIVSYLLRYLTPDLKFREGYIAQVPLPKTGMMHSANARAADYCLRLKQLELNSREIIERGFDCKSAFKQYSLLIVSLRHTIEGFMENSVRAVLDLSSKALSAVLSETGTPAGWHPLIAGYDAIPELPDDLDLPPLPQEVLDYVAQHERIHPSAEELARIKANLQTLYEAGPGASEGLDLEEMDHYEDKGENAAGAYIPIPTETFLEELSVKLQIHPISAYWLLEELRAEGVRCKPEEQRLLEDRLSVLMLRLLGHRWPKQLERGEPAPPWADADGIIPLTAGTGEPTLADRVRERLRAEEGALGAQRTEALLEELTGRTLEAWLQRDFFKHHVRQFKHRPIAWYLASSPQAGRRGSSPRRGGRSGGGSPAFECLLYYHASAGDVLARIRTQYVEPLLRAQRKRAEDARRAGDDTTAALATARIHELEDFAIRLRQVEEAGFVCDELDDYIASEPLDRWSGDGYRPPASRESLLLQEHAWRVDINDGVRVNIAPLQRAGLLADNVLSAKDVRKAIADRARWRADERRWVRAGKLPRCGWMDESVPEGRRWVELAPEREAERRRLAEKRQAVLKRLAPTADGTS